MLFFLCVVLQVSPMDRQFTKMLSTGRLPLGRISLAGDPFPRHQPSERCKMMERLSLSKILCLALNDDGENWLRLHALCESRDNASSVLSAIERVPSEQLAAVGHWREVIYDLHPDLRGLN
jgi:hypothetical protein